MTRTDEMREQVTRFHKEHPFVWDLFKRFTFEVIGKGMKHYSVNAIFERIRWEHDITRIDPRASFKLNNNYRAFYARRFMAAFPEYDGFFHTRKQTSDEGAATNLPELTPHDYQQRKVING